jgi:hypothetical protein
VIEEENKGAIATPEEPGAGPMRTVVEGEMDAPRTVVVRFDEFVGKILGVGEPDEEAERELLAGAQLIEALEEEID